MKTTDFTSRRLPRWATAWLPIARTRTWLLALAILLGASMPCRANLIQNGDFEFPPVAGIHNFDTYYAGQSFPGWTVGEGSIDIVHRNSWVPASGDQSVDLTGYSAGSLIQDVPTEVGATYQLRFALSGNPGYDTFIPLIVTMEFLWAGHVVDTLSFDTTGRTLTDMGWTYYDYSLTTPTELTRITFRSLTDVGFRGAALDDVSLTLSSGPLVPVPDSGGSTGFLLLLGLLFLRRIPSSISEMARR